jgi:hypothetical protein
MRGEWNHARNVKIKVSTPALFAFSKHAIKDPEQLQSPFFSATMPSGRMLNCEWICFAVMAAYFEATMASSDSTHKVNVGQKALNPNKVLVLVP